MANPTFYLTNLETWTNAQDMDVESWLADVYQVADITQLPYQRVVKLKTTGMAKGWVERWALEFATDGSKEKFSTDFRAEIARPRTTASTYAEIMSIKQKTGELTDRYIARMKANIKLLQLTSKPDATLYTLTDDAEATFSIAFCRGLMPGHPFKVKNRDPEPTLAGTYAALAKYCRHNQYEEETYEDKIRKEAERLAPRHTTGSIEIAGTKIPAAEFQAFRKDFEPETLTAEVDEMVKMFESWSLASLEDQTSAGRVARTIARLPVAVARKVFGHTRFAQHIRGGAIEMPASRQVVQPSATPASTGPRLSGLTKMVARVPLFDHPLHFPQTIPLTCHLSISNILLSHCCIITARKYFRIHMLVIPVASSSMQGPCDHFRHSYKNMRSCS